MPTQAGPGTNRLRCATCGRYFNEESEFRDHQKTCVPSAHTGHPDAHETEGRDSKPEHDRDWVSTP